MTTKHDEKDIILIAKDEYERSIKMSSYQNTYISGFLDGTNYMVDRLAPRLEEVFISIRRKPSE